ncbi:hypothetical protein CVT24_005008 [Panaeolus cyanescens]|uniref:Poly A polymerase head domain-containing protein n=1 Tax=Panaeolus cyanescens TaxID=181874 RepID=A0A409YB86_9AGAR|nr:hypothetical protein CVT24_005008 [Panaeolus cyanescens]
MIHSLPRVVAPQSLQVQLTDTEKSVCELLDQCTTYLNKEKHISTTCRIAGGWVRDKLLGSESNDIDVALSNIMGLPFAQHLSEYAQTQGITVGTVSKIEQNPDQSKHLETATFKVFGLDIDLVNLRSEEYAEGSRIPTEVSFGTPLQDALRRDITINALFYNIHTRAVEDLTERGLEDLRLGIIRTPLPPLETFRDDPLRILRCIRFASRFGFEMVDELKDAARNPSIQAALISKVARERVGDEVCKMLKGRDPFCSVRLIYELNLYEAIFLVIPDEIKSQVPNYSSCSLRDGLKAVCILHTFLNESKGNLPALHPCLTGSLDLSSKARLQFACLLSPLRHMFYQDKKNKSHQIVESLLRDSLKLGTQDHLLDGVPALHEASKLISDKILGSTQSKDRVDIGLFLRQKCLHNPNTGSLWSTSIFFSLIMDLVPTYDYDGNTFNDEASKIISSYNAFVTHILELNLHNDVDMKPLLNGKEVMAILGVSKSGPWMSTVLGDIIVWQLGHPTGSKTECTEWLRKQDVKVG